jgi:hypothetical protein
MKMQITKEALEYVISLRERFAERLKENCTPILTVIVNENDSTDYSNITVSFDKNEKIPSDRFIYYNGILIDVAQYFPDDLIFASDGKKICFIRGKIKIE